MNSKPNASSSSFEPVVGAENSFPDPNRLIQLLSSIAVMPGGLESKRFRVASELCLDLKANVLISQSLNLAHPGDEPPTCPAIHMHSREKGWQQLPQSLLATEFSDLSKILQDLTNSLLSPNSKAASGPEGVKLFSPVPGLLFLADLTGNRLKYYAIARLNDRRVFSSAEMQFAHDFASMVPWLFRAPAHTFVDTEVEQLSPRLKSILILMLEGEDRQHIADDLGLSVHTVNSYFKDLFRHFKVNSHLQLIQKLHHLNRDSPLLRSNDHKS